MITKLKKYLVGGAVRDMLLDIPVKEKDWLIVGVTPKYLLSKGYYQVGKEFPVFIHPNSKEEYALARKEKKTSFGHKGFNCYTSPSITVEEDLFRRDLTINAMAIDKDGNIIDPYNGKKDIESRVLRHVSESFKDDPLRVLRVARFAARFAHLNFTIAPETLNIMKQMKKELFMLSPERVWKETVLALSTNNPHIFFIVLKECKALNIIFPEIYNLFGKKIFLKCKNTINAGNYALSALANSVKISNNINIRFITLCFNLPLLNNIFNKKKETDVIYIMYKRLKLPNKLFNLLKIVNDYYNTLVKIHHLDVNSILNMFNRIGIKESTNRINQIILISKANFSVCKKFKNHMWYICDLLFDAYNIVKNLKANIVMKDGFVGKDISHELTKRRLLLLNKWKLNLKTR
ncbi:MAG: CCA tRNA nucleotidyltransferase [Candidatus Lightella neohaematopini]|nr:CCA tRNA nucleotidyltransferase [Candidatus Lightella neohaematopini]MCV2529039.1 CCA tRNA nucleotidyltransferase [Candidatus Lightella neohaematopini]